MILRSLQLQYFRSYTKKSFVFSPSTTLILGPNAAGKTNILEAIMLLATGKSFRAEREIEVMQWEKQLSIVSGQLLDDERLEIQMTPLKRFLVNGVPRRMIDFVGNLHAVLFWPEDLELITDSPSIRRKFLDSVLVQGDREYRRNLNSYERGLRQRNKLLDQINDGTASRSQLVFWDQLLIKAGDYITQKREDFLRFASGFTMPAQYTALYDKSIISPSRLEQYKEQEIAAKSTLVGPHRDDFIVFDGERQMSKFGSRGEQRLAVLWLKLSQLAHIEAHSGSRPILLLDDIFSELDTNHRKIILDAIALQQTIVTSANPDIINELHVSWETVTL